MSSDTEKHQQLLSALRTAQGDHREGSFEQAVTHAFEHVFEHLEHLNAHVSQGGSDGEEQTLQPGESPTLR